MGLRRGDIVTAAPPGDFGKPRPVLVLHDVIGDENETVTVALITGDLSRVPSLRITAAPSLINGLRKPSAVRVDLIQTLKIEKVGEVIGSLEPETMRWVEVGLKLHLGLS